MWQFFIVQSTKSNATDDDCDLIICTLTHMIVNEVKKTWCEDTDIPPFTSAYQFGIHPVNSDNFTAVGFIASFAINICPKHNYHYHVA